MRKTLHIAAALILAHSPVVAQETGPILSVELNAEANTEAGCLLTFLISNGHAEDIESAVFETVLFDSSGKVERLTLFDFGALPAGTPRVRQFQMGSLACDALGKVLINGASTCTVAGSGSPICATSLNLITRTDTELLG